MFYVSILLLKFEFLIDCQLTNGECRNFSIDALQQALYAADDSQMK
jgi:hypothetical protein